MINLEISVALPVSSVCFWHRKYQKSEHLGFNPALQPSGHTQGEESLWYLPINVDYNYGGHVIYHQNWDPLTAKRDSKIIKFT